ncbi:MAG TPA: heat-inducible transcriptional repressor HrcA [Bryobacteraceae bacterium]|jgi:heat-inducible transcriptional repressor|nr:heat-inducible transcriptional repressor HrcA [Bryobacteraceae bacterium]
MPLSGRELSPRERDILHLIVRAYIDLGEPVGSRTLSRMRHLSLSPATIRNVMADLADEGYLSQPHTSAGRIPTDKAFRDFAGAVSAKPLPASDRDRILNQMYRGESLEERVAIASRVLTELTRNVGIAAALPSSSQELEHIELVGLSGRRILMIVATRDKMVRNRVVTLDREFRQDELVQLRNYVNVNFAGWTLERARAELLRRIEEERAMYDAVLQQLTLLCQKGLLAVDDDPQLAMDGASWLVGLDLHLTRERMRELFRALEEKKRVVALLDRFLETSQGQVGIHVGLEDAHPAMRELTLIGVTVDLPSGVRARVAVLGPMRMHYERVISAVQQIGRTFETL